MSYTKSHNKFMFKLQFLKNIQAESFENKILFKSSSNQSLLSVGFRDTKNDFKDLTYNTMKEKLLV